MERKVHYFDVERTDIVPELEVAKVAPAGLGYGEGSISYELRKDRIGSEVLENIEQAIDSPDILVAVSTDKNGNQLDDDGCGDGRNVGRIFEGTEERTKSLSRPKVFGGGAAMATATLIGLGKAESKSIREAFSDGMSVLRDNMIGFGAHTDSHPHDDGGCGCGAIDKAPVIITNAVKLKDEIRGSIKALGIDTTGVDDVFNAYAAFAGTMDAEIYQGSDVMGEIIDNGKVVKELDDNHKEMVVILNMVEGYTVDQEKIRTVSGNEAQAFAVDVWRVKQIADRIYPNDQSKPDDEERASLCHKALLSELVYTLATAATLTKGDLPVYVVQEQFATAA